MPSVYPRFVRDLTFFGCCGFVLLAACAPKERDLSQLKSSAANSGGSGVGGGASSTAGRGATGTTAGGTTTSVQAGTSSVGAAGSAATGGTPASGGLPAKGGQSSNGGTLGVAGATTVQGGSGGVASANGGASGAIGTGGVVSAAGTTGVGGAIATGGAIGVGGVSTGGVVGTGGGPACVPTTNEVCNDGIDNDCNGNVDCPVVTGRYPDPTRASAGDDAWAQLAPPAKTIKQVECRSGKPGAAATKPWLVCDTANPTALTVYSMGLAEAKLPVGNGVTQFDFRFVFTDGKVSDPRSIVYYAHNSLWDTTKGTPTRACPVAQPDSRYFDAARPYIAPSSTTIPTFATNDAQLKPPFIFLRFFPAFGGRNFTPTTTPSEIRLLSLRHRFVIDAGKQMLLVTRSYRSTRSAGTPSADTDGSCLAATIQDRDSEYVTLPAPKHNHVHKKSPCEAIVLNRAGTGVCISNISNVLTAAYYPNSSAIITFLNVLGIPWPKADPMMWQKFFQRGASEWFSPKCTTENQTTCLVNYPGAPVLPDSGDVYFTTP